MPVDVRLLDPDDRAAAAELGRLAFGGPRRPAGVEPEPPPPPRPGRVTWGAFDAGRLVAMATDRAQGHWFGGRLVPASGFAAVAVAPADRGRGHARTLLTAVLASLRDRGALVATLYATAPALYRGLGWERAGALTWADLPTSALARLRVPAGTTLRAAGPGDRAAVAALYTAVARAGSGYLDRDGLPPPPPDAEPDGTTLAVDDSGTVTGYTSWDRGLGYKAEAVLTVSDLVGATGAATTALLAALGTWGAVTPTLRLRLPDPDPVAWLLPTAVPLTRSVDPWMLRVIDAAGAVAARGWPPDLKTAVDLDVVDPQAPWNAGRHRLEVTGGAGRLTPGGAGTVAVGARGLALLYAGSVPAAVLRRGGLLDGGDAHTDRVLDALSAGPHPALLDYF